MYELMDITTTLYPSKFYSIVSKVSGATTESITAKALRNLSLREIAPAGTSMYSGAALGFLREAIMTATAQVAIVDQVHRHRVWFILLGILLMVAGVCAIAFPVLGSLTVELWAAIAFLIAGGAQTVHAFAAMNWSGFFLGLLVGLLYLSSGLILWANPLRGVMTLTVFLSAVFLVDGVFRSTLAFQIRSHAGWFWVLIGGLLSIVVAAMIFMQLPSSAAWALGTLLGINMLFSGMSFLALVFSAADVQKRAVA
jgi:uncharacterized membrane protein HdeD (DUF308 family)